MRKMTLLICSTALLMSSSAALRAQDPVSADQLEVYTERVKTGFIDWGNGYAEVVVEAPYETDRYGGSHAKIRAIEAATEIARKALYRLLRGINITGGKRLAGDAELEETLTTLVKKQSSLESQKTANVTMTATFRMPIFGPKALSGKVQSQRFKDAEKGELAGTSGTDYTSVVLDAGGTSLQAALLPRILAEDGTLLFGPADLDEKAAAAVTYVVRGDGSDKSLRLPKAAAKMLGDKPLVIKVEKVGGEFLADVVLRPEQADRLRGAQPGELLGHGHLFILQTNSIDLSGS